MALDWYLVGLVALAIWYIITAFVLQPYLVLRRLMIELREPKFQGLISNYLIAILNAEQTFKDKEGKEQKATIFQILLSQAGDYLMWRGEQWINAQRSAMSRNADKAAALDSPIGMMVQSILPKKLKKFAGLIDIAGLVRAGPAPSEETAKKPDHKFI